MGVVAGGGGGGSTVIRGLPVSAGFTGAVSSRSCRRVSLHGGPPHPGPLSPVVGVVPPAVRF